MAVAATTGRQRVVRGAALNQPAGANWAGNVTFAATGVARPRTVAEVQEVVADAARRGERVHAVGARHSFTAVGDTDGVLVDTDALCEVGAVDETAATVTVGAGIRYAELAPYLDERGWALGNLPSLPHVSVAGAVATATHGSGDSNPVLADAVRAVDLVTAPGEHRRLERATPTRGRRSSGSAPSGSSPTSPWASSDASTSPRTCTSTCPSRTDSSAWTTCSRRPTA